MKPVPLSGDKLQLQLYGTPCQCCRLLHKFRTLAILFDTAIYRIITKIFQQFLLKRQSVPQGSRLKSSTLVALSFFHSGKPRSVPQGSVHSPSIQGTKPCGVQKTDRKREHRSGCVGMWRGRSGCSSTVT